MYVELNCKSNFSFLRGASDSREYVLRAQETGMPALGVADINGVYGLPRAYEAVRDYAPEMKLLCGSEITLLDFPAITLIAKTRIAWGLLCRIITQVHAGKEKGQGFITLDELEFLTRRFPGADQLVCLLKNDPKNDFRKLQQLFSGNIYLTLCRYLDGLDNQRT
ncbi:MAG: PHP domain-containing protein, partial [Proteobacteria bacterium]